MASYSISSNLVVSIWESDDQEGVPYVVQTRSPKGRPWKNYAEAELFAETLVSPFGVIPSVFEDDGLSTAIEGEPELEEEAPTEEEPSA